MIIEYMTEADFRNQATNENRAEYGLILKPVVAEVIGKAYKPSRTYITTVSGLHYELESSFGIGYVAKTLLKLWLAEWGYSVRHTNFYNGELKLKRQTKVIIPLFSNVSLASFTWVNYPNYRGAEAITEQINEYAERIKCS